MAIDFGRMLGKVARPARNIATGYLSAKIANTEANDELKADMIKRVGINFIENSSRGII